MSIGERLKGERLRLGKTQAEFGSIGGVQMLTQRNYENGSRSPTADYLVAVEAAGADVLYVLVGRHEITESAMSTELTRMGDAWEVLETVLAKLKHTISAKKKRVAVDAIYRLLKLKADAKTIEATIGALAA